MRKRIAILLSLMLMLSAACLPWIEPNEETVESDQYMMSIRLLFSDLTDTAFIPYFLENAVITHNESLLEGFLEIDGYGISNATGHLSITLKGVLDNGTLDCNEYVLSGNVIVNDTEIAIDNAEGFTDNLSFRIADELSAATPSRIRYPRSGSIKTGDEAKTLVMMFPEDAPLQLPEILTDEELKAVRNIVRTAFEQFEYIPEHSEMRSFGNGIAELGTTDGKDWFMEIRGETENSAVTIKLSSSMADALVILGDRNITIESSCLMNEVEIPQQEATVILMSYLEALRGSNMLFALRGLINGSSSGVITLEELTEDITEMSFTAKLSLSGYGLGTGSGKSVSGLLYLTLSGKTENSMIIANSYSASSDCLSFYGLEKTAQIRLSGISGNIEDGTITLKDSKAIFTGDPAFGLPHSGKAETEGGRIEF